MLITARLAGAAVGFNHTLDSVITGDFTAPNSMLSRVLLLASAPTTLLQVRPHQQRPELQAAVPRRRGRTHQLGHRLSFTWVGSAPGNGFHTFLRQGRAASWGWVRFCACTAGLLAAKHRAAGHEAQAAYCSTAVVVVHRVMLEVLLGGAPGRMFVSQVAM